MTPHIYGRFFSGICKATHILWHNGDDDDGSDEEDNEESDDDGSDEESDDEVLIFSRKYTNP